jgi:hypothetical protein
MITVSWLIESTHRSPFGGDRIEVGRGELKIDGFLSQTFDFGLDVSTMPIEKSQDITDHARPTLKVHRFQCSVSDDPFNPTLQEEDHSDNVLGGLDYLIENAIPVDVETDRAVYEDYLIIQRSGSRDQSTGDGADFTLTIQQVEWAELETVDTPAPSVERARPNSDNGNNPANSTGSDEPGTRSPESAARRSWLQSGRRTVQRSGGQGGIIDRSLSMFFGRSQGV